MRTWKTAGKASVPLWIGCTAAGLLLPEAECRAGAPLAAACAVAAAAPAQFAAANSTRRSSDDLLRQARAAIKRGDYQQAETLINDAEKLGVKYDELMDRWADKPESLRKLLAQQRAQAASGKSGFRLPPLFGGAAQQPATKVPADPTAKSPPPAAPGQLLNSAVDQITGDAKSRAASLLKDARAALAKGDKLAALAAWQKAAAANAMFGPGEDSPQRVAEDLVRAGVDPARLVPVSTNPTAPLALRPGDVDHSAEHLPQLGASGSTPPAVAAPSNASPYMLPVDANPLMRSGVAGGGSFQPINSPAAPAANVTPAAAALSVPAVMPAAATGQEPQRLPVGDDNSKAEAARLVAQARLALDQGDLQTAARLAEQAEALNVPDTAFGPGEIRPWQMSLEANRAMVRSRGVVQASGTGPAATEPRYPVAQGLYNPAADTTQVVLATAQQDAPLSRLPQTAEAGAGLQLYQEGLQALQAQDRTTAMQKFAEAWKYQDQFDPETRQQLKDKLMYMRSGGGGQGPAAGERTSPLEQVNSQQELLRQKLVREVLNEEKAAQQQAQTDPKGALANLKKLRERLAAADVEPAARKQLLTMADRMIGELSTYIDQNKATLEAKEKNDAVKNQVIRDQDVKIEMQGKLAELVEQFNRLMDEKRYPEAEVIARQANEIAPNEAVVVNMIEKAKLAHRIYEDLANQDGKERGFIKQMLNIDQAAIPFNDNEPFVFGDVKKWSQLTKSRSRLLEDKRRMTPAEVEIQKSLSKGVEVKFTSRPLAEVMDMLGRMAGVNVYLDPQGLAAEGVTTDTPVTLNLTQPISYKSALNLVLSPLGLSYVIQDEVLRITSEQTRDANVYAHAYYVADLVMPIPNFLPNYNLGLPGAIRESMNAMMGLGTMPRSPTGVMPLTVAKDEGQPKAANTSTEVLAQINNLSGPGGLAGGRGSAPSFGPGGLGGGVHPDFDSLIELVTSTIAPQSWAEVGGPGTIAGFENNLSLVVSQTQEVHEALADLLEQLRRLQDLQVTIEVRFITLADNFFERIGVDFQLSIDDNTGLGAANIPFLPSGPNDPVAGSNLFDDSNNSLAIGWTAAGLPTGDLDVKLTQGSGIFGATPQFGGFDPNATANFGFAILSDLEAFFVLAAGQGDQRANILQAPKVTMFNGQFASVSDTTQRPFVTTVIPVVGDFAAAQQPVIVVLNEGTSLSVQAVVSSDRRFVRLTMVPFFSQIGDVQEFTFTGTVTTDSGTTVQDPTNPKQNVADGAKKTISGTTVQLPTFAFTSVTTTVSVPDGGTVLMGGIKRLREGRVERGVPVLSKVPWVNRLFKNVGIGREAQSLMMMVTPRIIIQEEEEERLGIELPAP